MDPEHYQPPRQFQIFYVRFFCPTLHFEGVVPGSTSLTLVITKQACDLKHRPEHFLDLLQQSHRRRTCARSRRAPCGSPPSPPPPPPWTVRYQWHGHQLNSDHGWEYGIVQ